MTRASAKSNQAATAASPTKAAASSPTQSKFGKAFSKTHASSPTKGKTTTVDVDHEILTPFGTCLVTFLQHNKSKSACVCPLLKNLEKNAERIYETCRIFSQAALFDPDTPDQKQKKTWWHPERQLTRHHLQLRQRPHHRNKRQCGRNIHLQERLLSRNRLHARWS
jgi:hypothetical protein